MPPPAMTAEYVVAVTILALPLLGAYIFLVFRRLRTGKKWDIVRAFEEEHKSLSTPASHGFAYLTALAGFIAFVPISVLALFLVAQMVAVVSNPSVRWMLFQGPDNALRNWLELCAFAATAIVAGVAWFALRFAADQARQARKQADEAEHSRAAQVYLQITGRFMSPSMSTSRVLVSNLYGQFRAASPFATAGEFFHDQLQGLYNSEYMSHRLAYLQHIEILTFFEDVGVLVDRDYVKIADIKLLFRGSILTIEEMFECHIKARRASAQDDAVFENFTKLCELMKKP